jgi:hypothetical protein
VESKRGRIHRVRYREIIADNLSKAGWSWGCVSAVDSSGRTMFIADAYRDDGKRFIVHADEKLTAFVELESAIRASQWLAAAVGQTSVAFHVDSTDTRKKTAMERFVNPPTRIAPSGAGTCDARGSSKESKPKFASAVQRE